MRDPLNKYLKSNREKLDTYVPDSSNWEAIENRIQRKKFKSRFLWMGSSAAAIILVFFMFSESNMHVGDARINNIETQKEPSNPRNELPAISWNSSGNRTNQKVEAKINGLGIVDGRGNMSDLDIGSIGGEMILACSNLSVTDNCGNTTYVVSDDLSEPEKPEAIAKKRVYELDHYYEQYDEFIENAFESPLDKPLSTFGIDVDGAGYSNVRRFINSNFLPPKDAVKLEEMINYFNYDFPEPEGDDPFSITTEIGKCPWEKDNLILQVAINGERIDFNEDQSNNIVFLIDVSGSMNSSVKLPLLKKSLKLMVNELGEDDKIALVVYAGAAGLVLPSTTCDQKETIYEALENLSAGGSTAGAAGIELAYKIAQEEFIKTGNNRVILATDGDFNVGVSEDQELTQMIEEKRETGVYLSVLGFGTGNLQSSKMEKLADNGNGNYSYIDNILEAKKVLVDEIGGTLITIAKDVKLQLEFNQDYVKSYRLLGYENRSLETKDFNDDLKDSGDLGSGHTVVALYEIIMQDEKKPEVASKLRYQKQALNNSNGIQDELVFLKLRYKQPDSSKSKLISRIVKNEVESENSDNFIFATSVAEFGLLLRESKYRSNASFNHVINSASKSQGKDKNGYRSEFIELVKRSKKLMEEYKASTGI